MNSAEPPTSQPQGILPSLVVLLILPCVSLGVLWFWAMRANGLERTEIKIPLLIALAAASTLTLISTKWPSLMEAGEFGMPRAIAAPMVHGSLMALISALATTAPLGIQRAPDPLLPAAVWLDARALALSAVGQLILLIALNPWLQRNPANKREPR